MILDDLAPQDDPAEPDEHLDDDVEEFDDLEDEGWLDGLRRAGLPVVDRRPAALNRAAGGGVAVGADVAALVDASWAPSTRQAYANDWQSFAAWCDVSGIEPLGAAPEDVAGYVAYLVGKRFAVSTIRRQVAAIRHVHHLADRPSPTGHPLVARTMAGAARTLGTTQRRAAPLRLADLRTILHKAPIVRHKDNPAIVQRDVTLLAVGWAAALRCSELVALNAEHLRFDGDPDTRTGGLTITVPTSKTSTEEAHIAVPWSHTVPCPARIVFHHTRRVRTGPMFRSINRHGQPGRRLHVDSVSVIVKAAVADILGYDPANYSAHSLRAGFVTEARANHTPNHLITRHTRHRDPRCSRSTTAPPTSSPTPPSGNGGDGFDLFGGLLRAAERV